MSPPRRQAACGSAIRLANRGRRIGRGNRLDGAKARLPGSGSRLEGSSPLSPASALSSPRSGLSRPAFAGLPCTLLSPPSLVAQPRLHAAPHRRRAAGLDVILAESKFCTSAQPSCAPDRSVFAALIGCCIVSTALQIFCSSRYGPLARTCRASAELHTFWVAASLLSLETRTAHAPRPPPETLGNTFLSTGDLT